jgi:hypothetical protein
MEEASGDDLREELAALEAVERRLSAERRRLQRQMDFGFEKPTTRARERRVSDQRRELHRQIDALRDLLRMQEAAELGGAQQDSAETGLGEQTLRHGWVREL